MARGKMLPMVLAAVFSATAAAAQPADAPAFDVASIRMSEKNRPGGDTPFQDNIQATPGSLTMRNVTLADSIAWAYHVFEFQVSGPDWSGSARYDIVAKAAGPATEPELRRMLQTLLADRFKLTLHRETKEMGAYLLLVGKNGPKVQESKTEGDSNIQPDLRTLTLTVQRMPVSQLVRFLARVFHAPVVDMTGLTGRYDLTINGSKYMPQPGETPDPLSLIQTGLQQELGLKLEFKKTAVDLLVVDSAEKAPIEN
jgi:uncharacterized protein (TIGR03435 family)